MEKISVTSWKFYQGDNLDAWKKDFDDKDWETINVPHDWAVTGDFNKNFSSGTGYLPGGIAWYRSTMRLDFLKDPKIIGIVFEGIYKNSEIWINGYHIGNIVSGYSRRRFDISEILKYRVDDFLTISVRVCHQDISDSRWYTGSGITRPVYLVVEELIRFEDNGVSFSTVKIGPDTTELNIICKVINHTEIPKEVIVRHELVDTDGKSIELGSAEIEISPKGFMTSYLVTSTDNLKLWSAESPYLYKLVSTISDEDDNLIEENIDVVGVRIIEYSPQNGLFINNLQSKLKGVCIHDDAGALGVAVPKSVWKRRLEKLKKCGVNAIRMSHNPHDKCVYELCDELGLYVFDEAFDEWENPKNKWWQGHNVYPPRYQGYAKDFPDWFEVDLRSMIDFHRNHPSIIAWSIGNEIDYPNDPYVNPLFLEMIGNNDSNKPEQERMYNPSRPDVQRVSTIAFKLANIVRALDNTRPVTIAAAFPELTIHTGLFNEIDLIGYNYKEHLYEEHTKLLPQKAFVGSENGHGHKEWLIAKGSNNIAGQFLWTGIDYLGEAKGWPVHGSPSGLLDLSGNEKDIYYLRKSWWTEEPMVYLVTKPNSCNDIQPTRRWGYEADESIDVLCYSNCDRVILFDGDNSLEMIYDNNHGYFKAQVNSNSSFIKCVGYKESKEVIDILETAQIASKMEFTTIPPLADDNVYQIECTLMDSNGNVAANDLTVSVDVEDGVLLGLENGDLSDINPYYLPFRRTHRSKLIVYVKGNANSKVILKAEGLHSSCIQLGEGRI